MSNSHLIVVGSGIAGLYGALLAAESGMRVSVVSKGALEQSNTHFAQGGICAVLGPGEAAPGDSVEAHIADTLTAGAGQCNKEAVRILCTEAAGDIAALERFGVVFDRNSDTGRRALGLEGAHSAARILHAGGDATGAAIADGLISAVHDAVDLGTISILEHAFVLDLMLRHGRVTGVSLLAPDGDVQKLHGDAVLLATGGAGQLFEFTTNPSVATADGLAAAWRAGADATDLEYFQFHPTALAVGGNFLISEAVRGAGAVLRDRHGERFMPRYHHEGDLAPRDVVSRSIAAHLISIGAVAGETVFLDATGVEAANGAGYLARRFPTIDSTTRTLGFDWTRDWLPVTPAAHYWMGGVSTDLKARTSLPGLFAAGEAACTGVHGANRLASNSLLEGLVFGRRAVQAFLTSTTETPDRSDTPVAVPALAVRREDIHAVAQELQLTPSGAAEQAPPSREALQRLMSSHAGVVRDADGLRRAASQIATWRSQPKAATATGVPTLDVQAADVATPADARSAAEFENLLLAAELLVHAALARENSVGAHHRSDFPEPPAAGRPADTSSTAGTSTSGTALNPSHLCTSLPILESETV
ncbi:L-aspartate oxidase [Arthrobacter sp.]|uniref:L-aspartate oxidase n=1 Tax=Arthrobacter sp. TaxID=1667 RepID=UPI0026E079F3|nr:L-aspartate oxidase [Arthrobacter sp.]MDO5751855.1 L-aspartate oxidase [Arthrobacter sp.]